ncbi:mitochondrial acidic matrix protein [Scheffersomyces amazonensis]|uniref:mitochondrial acidic matrix protein n=1 Tax=Scheffersomyces amazonensis TaxID=1078765 RepID=UPI00315D3E03
MLSSKVLSSAIRAQTKNLVKRVNVSKNITPTMLKCSNMIVARGFQSTITKYNAHADLSSVLQSELKVTKTVPNKLDDIYDAYLKDNKWEIVDNAGQSVVALTKKLDDGKIISVYFDIEQVADTPISDEAEQENFDSEEAASEEDEFDENEQVRNEIDEFDKLMCNVRIVLENPGSEAGIFINLILHSLENSFIIDYVSNHSNIAELKHEIESTGEFSDQLSYQGPRFSQLDESIQTQFEAYLSTNGIDDELAEFIVVYSEVKEENEYRSWLSGLVSFFK